MEICEVFLRTELVSTVKESSFVRNKYEKCLEKVFFGWRRVVMLTFVVGGQKNSGKKGLGWCVLR